MSAALMSGACPSSGRSWRGPEVLEAVCDRARELEMISLKGLQAVTFDVGGTLITPWPSVGHVYSKVAGRHGYPGLSPEVLDKRFAVAWSSLHGFEHARSQWARLVDATFEGLVKLPPS